MLNGRGRSVKVEDSRQAIVTVGDNSPVTITQADVPVFALRPLTTPPALPASGGPARLLNSRYELVQYVGAETMLSDGRSWLNAEEHSALRLITGAGGQGKTRFALELARRAGNRGWTVLFARHKSDGGLLANDALATSHEPINSHTGTSQTLIVLDYAERWPLDDLLTLVTRVDHEGGKVRFLLLARSAWFWPSLARTLEHAGVLTSQVKLSWPLEETDRARLHRSAVRSFTGKLTARIDISEVPTTPGHFGELSSPLSVQMLALVQVLRFIHGDVQYPDASSLPKDPYSLTQELLVREMQHWAGLRRASPPPISISDREMANAVVVGTLTRGTTPEHAVSLLEGLRLASHPQTIVLDHGVPYPVATYERALEPLLPDRLGEDFLASFLPGDTYPEHLLLSQLRDPFAPRALQFLMEAGTPENGTPIALSVLLQTASRWPHVANFVYQVFKDDPGRLVDHGGEVVAGAVGIPALSPLLPELGRVIEEIVGVRHNVELDAAAVVVQAEIVKTLRNTSNRSPEQFASALNTLAIRQTKTGQHKEASAAAEEAVHSWEQLSTSNRAYEIELARALGNLASIRAALGDVSGAIRYSGRELILTRRVDRASRGLYKSEIASLLANRAQYLCTALQYAEAHRLARESVALHEMLLREDRDRHLANAAASLEGLGRVLHILGETAASREHLRRALAMRRELAKSDPATHLPTLASSLTNIAIPSNAVDPFEAVTLAEESVRLFRLLHQRNPPAFERGLASALHTLATSLQLVERPRDGLPFYEEAIEFHRNSGGEETGALAESLLARALALMSVGRVREALEPAKESLTLYRKLVLSEPSAFQAKLDLAESVVASLDSDNT